jgi:hypothetical protein
MAKPVEHPEFGTQHPRGGFRLRRGYQRIARRAEHQHLRRIQPPELRQTPPRHVHQRAARLGLHARVDPLHRGRVHRPGKERGRKGVTRGATAGGERVDLGP